jgi:hypothetical protein
VRSHRHWIATSIVAFAVTGAGAVAAAPALADTSMADTSTAPASLPPVLANLGAAGNHLLDHLQYEHLEAPLLGFGPAVQDPLGWVTGHLIPVAIDTATIATTGQDPGLAP